MFVAVDPRFLFGAGCSSSFSSGDCRRFDLGRVADTGDRLHRSRDGLLRRLSKSATSARGATQSQASVKSALRSPTCTSGSRTRTAGKPL
jgi:hypothetical protein